MAFMVAPVATIREKTLSSCSIRLESGGKGPYQQAGFQGNRMIRLPCIDVNPYEFAYAASAHKSLLCFRMASEVVAFRERYHSFVI
jgi:hypothetical protein